MPFVAIQKAFFIGDIINLHLQDNVYKAKIIVYKLT